MWVITTTKKTEIYLMRIEYEKPIALYFIITVR